MEKEKWYSVLRMFLWEHRWTALMFGVYIAVFTIVFSLYRLETEAVLYAGGLCLLCTVPALAVSFFSYKKEHQERSRIGENVELLLNELPKPGTLAETDYQDMLRKLGTIFEVNMTAWQNERRESMDYYTTWVHQIKTPISVMRMNLQGEDCEENRVLLAELFRIEQYVEMALYWLRLGSDSTDFMFQEYALDGIIRQAVRKYASQFIRKRICLCYEPTDITVLTDEKWLLFVIEQLLSNAVKYTLEGSVSIDVTPDKILRISDTGIGIAPEDVPRIFEKGFTGYNGRADKKSTGLGLYLCRLTAGKLSHRIRVQSEPGEGTTFFLDMRTDPLEVE